MSEWDERGRLGPSTSDSSDRDLARALTQGAAAFWAEPATRSPIARHS
jgi:hypothetical protein